MTESEWLACDTLRTMLAFLEDVACYSDRKAKLFAVATCRRIWHLMPNVRTRNAIEVAERFADGEASRGELASAQLAVQSIRSDVARRSAGTAAAAAARHAAGVQRNYSTWNAAADARWAGALASSPEGAKQAVLWAADTVEGAAQAALLRDLVGPAPFRPMPTLSSNVLCWEDGCVVKLAAGLYSARDFSQQRMGVLADALEESGCTEAELLDHLRGPGPHVRGCWVVDLILGKE